MRRVAYVFFCIQFFFIGCGNEEFEPDKYIEYIESNNTSLIKSRVIGDYRFELKYTPTEYLVLKEVITENKKKSSSQINDEIKKRDDIQNYVFRIGLNDKNTDFLKYNLANEQEYYARVDYYSFRIQENLFLIEGKGKDTLPCIICHFEQNYGLSPYITMTVAFKNLHGKSKTFIYNDNILNIGKVVINFDIKNLPTLKTR